MSRGVGIVLLFLALPAGASAQGALTDQQRVGQTLFTQSCGVCHLKPQITANTYGPTLSKDSSDAAPLFVFVRDPGQPGPPLAVKRLASRFPQTVELTPADSMVPGRAFAAGQKVQVVARIARSGNPIAGSGDPFGEVAYLVGHDGMFNIVIDHVTP